MMLLQFIIGWILGSIGVYLFGFEQTFAVMLIILALDIFFHILFIESEPPKKEEKMRSPNQIVKETWDCEDGLYVLLPFRLLSVFLAYPIMCLIYFGTDKKIREPKEKKK